ncbi:adenosine kinase [Rhodovibrionaceae bacterium A322]
MSDARLDLVGIGNAIVDVLSHESEEFLVTHQLNKGAMTLIDTAQAEHLYSVMGGGVEVSGGSAANTIVGTAMLGGNCGFIGRVRNDQLGGIYRHDIMAAGVEFTNPPASQGPTTGRCLIMVTPDAQRTMNTYLGAAVELGPDDLDHDMIARAKVLYMEGYLWDAEPAKKAFVEAAKTAHTNGGKVALTLSDSFCVERHREGFLDLLKGHVDLLFANEEEILSLYQVSNFDDALQQVRGHCDVAALTRGAKGSVIVSGDEVHIVDAIPQGPVVDTTGAGDLYAAGFLYGYTQGLSLYESGRHGSLAAGEVISHMGPRPEKNLKDLAAQTFG